MIRLYIFKLVVHASENISANPCLQKIWLYIFISILIPPWSETRILFIFQAFRITVKSKKPLSKGISRSRPPSVFHCSYTQLLMYTPSNELESSATFEPSFGTRHRWLPRPFLPSLSICECSSCSPLSIYHPAWKWDSSRETWYHKHCLALTDCHRWCLQMACNVRIRTSVGRCWVR